MVASITVNDILEAVAKLNAMPVPTPHYVFWGGRVYDMSDGKDRDELEPLLEAALGR